jgi:hypothetical protein
MHTGLKDEFRIHFLCYPACELYRGRLVNWYDDSATKQTPKKHRDPLRGIFTPQENRIALCDAPGFEFSCDAVCLCDYPRISPTLHAIAAPLAHGNFVAMCGVGLDKIK